MKKYNVCWEQKQYGTSYVYANSMAEAKRLISNGKDVDFETEQDVCGSYPDWRVRFVEEDDECLEYKFNEEKQRYEEVDDE